MPILCIVHYHTDVLYITILCIVTYNMVRYNTTVVDIVDLLQKWYPFINHNEAAAVVAMKTTAATGMTGTQTQEQSTIN